MAIFWPGPLGDRTRSALPSQVDGLGGHDQQLEATPLRIVEASDPNTLYAWAVEAFSDTTEVFDVTVARRVTSWQRADLRDHIVRTVKAMRLEGVIAKRKELAVRSGRPSASLAQVEAGTPARIRDWRLPPGRSRWA